MPSLAPVTTPYYGGGQVKHPVDTLYVSGAPSTADVAHGLGTIAVDNAAGTIYGLASLSGGTATWAVLGGGSGAIGTITGDSGGALSPTGGNINILGTSAQITTTGSGSTLTLSIPSTFTAPGSIASTTTITSGTTLTATLGAITATNGNLVLAHAGNKLLIAAGANASCGVTTAMTGTPGAIAVATTVCTASSVILYSRATTGGTPGEVSVTAQSTSGFTLTSTGNETSTFNWLIIN